MLFYMKTRVWFTYFVNGCRLIFLLFFFGEMDSPPLHGHLPQSQYLLLYLPYQNSSSWRAFKSLIIRDTLHYQRNSVKQLTIHSVSIPWLTFVEINFFRDWLTILSKSWNLLVKLWGTITKSQLFPWQSCFISSLSWPLKVPHNNKWKPIF